MPAAHADETAPRQSVKHLFIGNSFSENAKKFLPELANAGGKKLVLGAAVIGGGTLQQHAERMDAWEKDPQSPEAKKYNRKSLHEFLTMEKWDYISLQQASADNWNIESYQPHAGRLAEFVKKHAPQAELIWHVTWSRHENALHKIKTPEKTFTGNNALIQMASRNITAALSIRHLVQAGQAVADVYSDNSTGFTLSTEPSEKQPFTTLHFDSCHLNTAGCYLAGVVWYEFLFQDSVVGNTFVPQGLTPEQARLLQEKAHAVGK